MMHQYYQKFYIVSVYFLLTTLTTSFVTTEIGQNFQKFEPEDLVHKKSFTDCHSLTSNLDKGQPRRIKRQDATNSGGGSTNVIGARITREATSGDWEMANFAAYETPSTSTRGRRRRRGLEERLALLKHFSSIGERQKLFDRFSSIASTIHKIAAQHPEKEKKFHTKTQELFALINKNPHLAQLFLMLVSQVSPHLHKNLVYNSTGVNCDHVCVPNGVGFGLLGLCTESHCKCDFTNGTHIEHTCPTDTVFDPIRLTCENPSTTLLCMDRSSTTAN